MKASVIIPNWNGVSLLKDCLSSLTKQTFKDFPPTLLFKNFRWLKIILVFFNTCLYQLKKGYFWPPILATGWLLMHLPHLLRERTKVQSMKKIPDDYLESFLQPKKITFWKLLR